VYIKKKLLSLLLVDFETFAYTLLTVSSFLLSPWATPYAWAATSIVAFYASPQMWIWEYSASWRICCVEV